jgi:hypothetical protein
MKTQHLLAKNASVQAALVQHHNNHQALILRRLHGGQFKQPIQQHAPSAVLVQTGLHLTLVRCLGVCSGNHKDKFHKIHISLLAEIYC